MGTTSRDVLKYGAIAAGGFALIAGAVSAAIGNYLIDYALVPNEDGTTDRFKALKGKDSSLVLGTRNEDDRAIILANREYLQEKRDAWLATIALEKVSIKSADGLYDLAGFIYPAPIPDTRWVILVHGYTGNHTDMEMIASFYGDQGYNVLIPDLRCHGESGGTLIGMGWPDRLDIIAWANYLIERYGSDISIVLHGHSMGGATVLMASGEDIPSQIVAVISDCAYTSVHDIFKRQVKVLFGKYPLPLLFDASCMFRLREGYSLKKASALDQVKKSKVPTLFIHGSADDFVPVSMVYPLYMACAAPKKRLLIIQGAGHAQSNQRDPERYFNAVFDFLSEKAPST